MGSLAFQWLQLPLSHLEGKGFCSNTPLLQGDEHSPVLSTQLKEPRVGLTDCL